jgi:hypothetical protein
MGFAGGENAYHYAAPGPPTQKRFAPLLYSLKCICLAARPVRRLRFRPLIKLEGARLATTSSPSSSSRKRPRASIKRSTFQCCVSVVQPGPQRRVYCSAGKEDFLKGFVPAQFSTMNRSDNEEEEEDEGLRIVRVDGPHSSAEAGQQSASRRLCLDQRWSPVGPSTRHELPSEIHCWNLVSLILRLGAALLVSKSL